MYRLLLAATISMIPLSAGATVSLAGGQPIPQTLGAVVSADGRLLLGNASFAQKNQDLEGTYYVFFPNDVRKCAFTASVIGSGSTPVDVPAIVTVANAFNTPRAVAIQIRTASGKLVPRGFHLILRCF